MERKPRILISGGGTGGHIFPALSIADACRRRLDADILFVGAEGRMEMDRVPAAGYSIKGLPVAGFNRSNPFKNFKVLWMLRQSMRKARQIISEFKPDVAVGVGGYASGPTLKAAQKAGIPTIIQEQNSYAGVTNKLLAPKAKAICVAYEGMERFFSADRIIPTGNPVRKNVLDTILSPAEARKSFGLDPEKPTLLVVGGSLGARTLNETMEKILPELEKRGIQVIWQTGKNYRRREEERERRGEEEKRRMGEGERERRGEGEKERWRDGESLITPFLTDMGTAYAAATLVVARAGAGTISELELLGKPCILVPSPNVAEDHQTKNAQALASRGAARMVTDAECREKLLSEVLGVINDPGVLSAMGSNIREMAMPESDEKIVDEVVKLLRE